MDDLTTLLIGFGGVALSVLIAAAVISLTGHAWRPPPYARRLNHPRQRPREGDVIRREGEDMTAIVVSVYRSDGKWVMEVKGVQPEGFGLVHGSSFGRWFLEARER